MDGQHQGPAQPDRLKAMNERYVAALLEFHAGADGDGAGHLHGPDGDGDGDGGGSSSPISELTIMCECSLDGCIEMVIISIRTYQHARERPSARVVAPDHLASDHEQLLEQHDGHWLVEQLTPA